MIQVIPNGDFCDIDINGMWSYSVPKYDAEQLVRELASYLNMGLTILPDRLTQPSMDIDHLQSHINGIQQQVNGAEARIFQAAQGIKDQVEGHPKFLNIETQMKALEKDLRHRLDTLEEIKRQEDKLLGTGVSRVIQMGEDDGGSVP